MQLPVGAFTCSPLQDLPCPHTAQQLHWLCVSTPEMLDPGQMLIPMEAEVHRVLWSLPLLEASQPASWDPRQVLRPWGLALLGKAESGVRQCLSSFLPPPNYPASPDSSRELNWQKGRLVTERSA